MKMRKKLAALLAVAMIASVMPMTAFAASANRVTHTVKVADDGETVAPQMRVELTDGLAQGKKFYLKLENAEWQSELAIGVTTSGSISGSPSLPDDGMVGYTVKRISDTEVEVEAAIALAAKSEIIIGLATKAIKGEATVELKPWDSNLTAGKFVFATSSAKNVTVTVADAPTFYTGKNLDIAKITLEENVTGALAGAQGKKIEITLDNDDYEFVNVAKSITYGKGLSSVTSGLTLSRDVKDVHRYVIEVTDASQFAAATQRGTVEIELRVNSLTKTPEVGDLKVEVEGGIVDTKELVVAKIAEYGVTLAGDKAYEFVAGQDVDVVFHLNETVDDSMVGGRVTEIKLPKGVYFAEKSTGALDVALKTGTNAGTIDTLRDADGRIEGFSVVLNVTNAIDKFKFEAKLDIRSAFEGDVTLTAEGRAIGEKIEAKLATVVAPVKVTTEPVQVKPGIKVQTGGKVIITETDKARLMQGKTIVITLEKESGMTIEGAKAKVVSGDLRANDIVTKTTKDGFEISIKRRSKEASTIEITDFELRLDRSVPQGLYDINVGGSAISTLADKVFEKGNASATPVVLDKTYGNDNIVSKDFIIVGDPITGVKSVVVFKIGSNKYTVDGVEEAMDANAYIQNGRTMVPVRYLAKALGVEEAAIKFNAGIVTIFVGNGNVVQLKVNSKDLITNGMTIPMVAAATIVDGRTYVPVTEIGSVFGVTGTWDSAAQTATFAK